MLHGNVKYEDESRIIVGVGGMFSGAHHDALPLF